MFSSGDIVPHCSEDMLVVMVAVVCMGFLTYTQARKPRGLGQEAGLDQNFEGPPHSDLTQLGLDDSTTPKAIPLAAD